MYYFDSKKFIIIWNSHFFSGLQVNPLFSITFFSDFQVWRDCMLVYVLGARDSGFCIKYTTIYENWKLWHACVRVYIDWFWYWVVCYIHIHLWRKHLSVHHSNILHLVVMLQFVNWNLSFDYYNMMEKCTHIPVLT